MPIFMCLGLSIGMAIGVAMDNIGVGMCLGVGIGTCLGTLMDYKNKKKHFESLVSKYPVYFEREVQKCVATNLEAVKQIEEKYPYWI